jgi:hypothetical protein
VDPVARVVWVVLVVSEDCPVDPAVLLVVKALAETVVPVVRAAPVETGAMGVPGSTASHQRACRSKAATEAREVRLALPESADPDRSTVRPVHPVQAVAAAMVETLATRIWCRNATAKRVETVAPVDPPTWASREPVVTVVTVVEVVNQLFKRRPDAWVAPVAPVAWAVPRTAATPATVETVETAEWVDRPSPVARVVSVVLVVLAALRHREPPVMVETAAVGARDPVGWMRRPELPHVTVEMEASVAPVVSVA